MKAGDYLICKKSYYIYYNEDTIINKINRFFKKPTFKKGEKYLLERILVNDYCPYVISCNLSSKFKIKFEDEFVLKHFYSKVEERKLKLKKISK
jgi:hypothetical protein